MKHFSWLLLMIPLLSLQCGYRLSGYGRNLPATAQTVYIPEFKNETANYQAGHFVTDAIRKEFISRSRLHASTTIESADLVLEGKINSFETTPVTDSGRSAAMLYEIRIIINVRLLDMKKNELYYEGSGLVFRETYETGTNEFFTQAIELQNKIATNLAANIVTAILDNF